MNEDRPAWARRIAKERKVRGWSQAEAVRAMHMHAPGELSSDASLLRSWKRWESGEVMPDDFHQPIIAAVFGTPRHAMFPTPPRRDPDEDLVALSGMDTLELGGRLQRSDMDKAALDAVRITADRLCREYPHQSAEDLVHEGPAGCDTSTSP